MSQKLVFNFAVVRFLPYPETEEFVNIGIVLACPQLGKISYRIESHRRERVTNFFPEMDADLFIKGRSVFEHEMHRIVKGLGHEPQEEQLRFQFKDKGIDNLFKEIVKPRESLFRFSRVGTMTADDETKAMERLFAYYVERQFAKYEEYHEKIMEKRLTRIFKAKDILQMYHSMRIGDDQYHVSIPFVHVENSRALKAIKPLDLIKDNTTRIIEYGDRWGSRIKRLKEKNELPDQLLFVVRQAKTGRKSDIALDIRKELGNLGTETLSEDENDKVLEFAKAI